MDDGSKLDVTVVKVVDPAKGADEFTTPASGKRFDRRVEAVLT